MLLLPGRKWDRCSKQGCGTAASMRPQAAIGGGRKEEQESKPGRRPKSECLVESIRGKPGDRGGVRRVHLGNALMTLFFFWTDSLGLFMGKMGPLYSTSGIL